MRCSGKGAKVGVPASFDPYGKPCWDRRSRQEYAVFALRKHARGVSGGVLRLES